MVQAAARQASCTGGRECLTLKVTVTDQRVGALPM